MLHSSFSFIDLFLCFASGMKEYISEEGAPIKKVLLFSVMGWLQDQWLPPTSFCFEIFPFRQKYKYSGICYHLCQPVAQVDWIFGELSKLC